MAPFSYRPLENKSTEIRLLKILPGDRDGDIHCTMSTYNRDKAPLYVAVSYTWGPPTPTRDVRLDEQLLSITENCWYVLWQMRLCSAGNSTVISSSAPIAACEIFWIDAICINQKDVFEKSAQVQSMGQIYENAVFTATCLGEAGEDSQAFVEMVPLAVEWYLDDSEQCGVPQQAQAFNQARRNAFRSFIERPYWKRLWIIQEVLRAKDVHLFVGEARTNWAYLEMVHLLYSIASSEAYTGESTLWGDRSRGTSVNPSIENLISGRGAEMDRDTFEHEGTPPKFFELSQCVMHYGAAECFDPRDKVYGLVSLVREPITVDYSKTPIEVLFNFVDNLGRSTSNLRNAVGSIRRLRDAFGIEEHSPQLLAFLRSRFHGEIPARPSNHPETFTFGHGQGVIINCAQAGGPTGLAISLTKPLDISVARPFDLRYRYQNSLTGIGAQESKAVYCDGKGIMLVRGRGQGDSHLATTQQYGIEADENKAFSTKRLYIYVGLLTPRSY